MKPRKILTILFSFALFANVCSQKLPENIPQDIRELLVEVKAKIELRLDSCRTNNNLGDYPNSLSGIFWNHPSTSELYQLNLNLGMLYDDEMIQRMIQLLNNEYREEELDTLVNRQMAIYIQDGFEQNAMWQMKNDSSTIFSQREDSLRKANKPYHYYDVGLSLKWDTTLRYRFVLDSIKKATREEVIQSYLNYVHFDIKGLIESCGYVNDKRLIKPLINITENPERLLDIFYNYNYDADDVSEFERNRMKSDIKKRSDELKRLTIEALVRMKIEPYYSDYLKAHSHSLQEIKEMKFAIEIGTLSVLLYSQESFLELSKYLHSSAFTGGWYPPGSNGILQYNGKSYENAIGEIKKYIENKDLWEIINKPAFDAAKDRFEIYDWMQKNYGKYQLKKIW